MERCADPSLRQTGEGTVRNPGGMELSTVRSELHYLAKLEPRTRVCSTMRLELHGVWAPLGCGDTANTPYKRKSVDIGPGRSHF
ncbi:unnamed protein product [Ixodes pacificus]